MPLSEHERKLLAQMEEAFIADDPRLVSTLTGTRLYPGRNRVIKGVSLIFPDCQDHSRRNFGLLDLFGGGNGGNFCPNWRQRLTCSKVR